jgi:hypothetical protein
VASHPLIDDYLTHLAGRLPADMIEELADGLTETFDRRRRTGLDRDAAARAAITEFGPPDLVLTAFVQQAPGRRAARILLGAGPAVGGCWAAVLVTAHAWSWPIPGTVRVTFGLVLAATVALLLVAATANGNYQRTRWALPASAAMIGIDLTASTIAALCAPALNWPTVLAVLASTARQLFTVRLTKRLWRHT